MLERKFSNAELLLLMSEWLVILHGKTAHYLSGVFNPEWIIDGQPISITHPLSATAHPDRGRMIFAHNFNYQGFPISNARHIARTYVNNNEYDIYDVFSIGPVVTGDQLTVLNNYLMNTDDPQEIAYSAQLTFTGPIPRIGSLISRGNRNFLIWNILLSPQNAVKLQEDVKRHPSLMVKLLEVLHLGISQSEIKHQTTGIYIITDETTTPQLLKDCLYYY